MARSAPFSRGEDPKIERARRFKSCYCGFHSAKNRKKNRHHHSTLMKWSYQLMRRAKYATMMGAKE